MPIKSVEKQILDRGVLGNFPRLGKLRKGAEKTEKGAGRDQDHFRLTLESPYEHIRPAFLEALFGERPQEFHNVLIAADSPEQAFQYWNESWGHARLLKRCDEETIIVHWDEADARYSSEPLECTCDPLQRNCKQHGRLDIVIPALFEATGVWGKFTVETTSIYDVIALRSYMAMADAFMQKLHNVAFWSVPFTIGRAMRDVPVTINGKRSIKAMSLLFAQIEPDFNQQVFTPMLTRPAQLLLEGINLETGEAPEGRLPDIEAEFTSAQDWDADYVFSETAHLFNHRNHFDNTVDEMIANGELNEAMDDDAAHAAILRNRAQREAEKNAPKSRQDSSPASAAGSQGGLGADWLQDAKRLNAFIAKAHSELTMNTGSVLEALRIASEPQRIENVQDFAGSDLEAWAACVAFKVMYQPDALTDFVLAGGQVYYAAIKIIEAHRQRIADIPF